MLAALANAVALVLLRAAAEQEPTEDALITLGSRCRPSR
jgi:hypothetical protein